MQKSRPARALWIEIKKERKCNMAGKASRPARALWIEMLPLRPPDWPYSSRPARALWIEIWLCGGIWNTVLVEAREGLVD